MTKKILILSVVGLACALTVARAETPDFGVFDMKDVQAAAARMPTPYASYPRRPGRGGHSRTRAESVNVSLGIFSTTSSYLPNCGGSVTLRIIGGRAVVSFDAVSRCSNFDILASNLDPVRYPNQKLFGRNGDRYRSFEIPQQILDWGYNSIVVSMKSDTGIHRDLISVNLITR